MPLLVLVEVLDVPALPLLVQAYCLVDLVLCLREHARLAALKLGDHTLHPSELVLLCSLPLPHLLELSLED